MALLSRLLIKEFRFAALAPPSVTLSQPTPPDRRFRACLQFGATMSARGRATSVDVKLEEAMSRTRAAPLF